jgi:hypothetical protein
VPLVLTMLRTSPTGQWRDDLPVLRALGLVPSGTEGFVSTALTQAFALLPLGGRLLRAGWVSALGLALASALAYRLIAHALGGERAAPRLAPPLALAATLTAVLAPSWQLEGTLAGGVSCGVALALGALCVAVFAEAPSRPLALGALSACTLLESHAAALALLLSLGALQLVQRRLYSPREILQAALGASAPLFAWSLFLLVRPHAPGVELNLSAGLGSSSLLADAAAERTTALGAWLSDAGILPCALALCGLALGVFRARLRAVGAPFLVLVLCDVGFPAGKIGLLAADRLAPVRLLSLIAIAGASAVAVQAIALGMCRARLPMARPASVLLVVFHFSLAFVAAEGSAHAADRRRQLASEVWTDEALDVLPHSALLLVRSEALAYRLWAAQLACGTRSDVVVIPEPLLERGNVRAKLLRTEPALAPLMREMALNGAPSEFALSSLADARPLFVEFDSRWGKRLRDHLAPRAFFPRFAAHPLGRSDRKSSLEGSEEGLQRVLTAARQPPADAATLAVLQGELASRAELLLEFGDFEAAESVLASLHALAPQSTLTGELQARLIAARDRHSLR